MSFWIWLKKQKDRDDPVGDLARDAIRDLDIRRYRRIEKMTKYLSDKLGVSDGAKNAMRMAISEYVDFIFDYDDQ